MKLTAGDIIYEDKEIIVCHKKAGIATQTARLGEQDMENALKNYLRAPYIGVVHRLDQPVEGILVFAKTKHAAAELSNQSKNRVMNKIYYAIVVPEHFEEGREYTLTDYLLRNGKDNTSKVVSGAVKDAKLSELSYRVEKILKAAETAATEQNGKLALVKIHLKTGRHHQIRVQMSNAGMPLLGDVKYGNEESVFISRERKIRNVALCACSLDFMHPDTGKKMEFMIEPEGEAFIPFLPINP